MTQATVQVKAPEGVTNASHDGVAYTIGEDGFFQMPEAAASALQPMGFAVVKVEAPADLGNAGLGQDSTADLEDGQGNDQGSQHATESTGSGDIGQPSEGNPADAPATDPAAENDNAAAEGEGSAPDAGESTEPASTIEQADGEQTAVETLEGEGGLTAPEAPEVKEGGDGSSDSNAAA